jgi:flagellum-specific peptidoglycan hydrolase FlgJ
MKNLFITILLTSVVAGCAPTKFGIAPTAQTLKVKNHASDVKELVSLALLQYEQLVKGLNEAKTAEEKYKIKMEIKDFVLEATELVQIAHEQQPSTNPRFDQIMKKAIADNQNAVDKFKQAATPAQREQALDKWISVLVNFLVYARGNF